MIPCHEINASIERYLAEMDAADIAEPPLTVKVTRLQDRIVLLKAQMAELGSDRSQLVTMADQARTATGSEELTVVADRGYFSGKQILACEEATVEHTFGTLKMWMGSTHFLTRTLNDVAAEMSLHVLAYNFKRVLKIMGVRPLMAAIRAG